MALPFWLIIAPLAWVIVDSFVSKKTTAMTTDRGSVRATSQLA